MIALLQAAQHDGEFFEVIPILPCVWWRADRDAIDAKFKKKVCCNSLVRYVLGSPSNVA